MDQHTDPSASSNPADMLHMAEATALQSAARTEAPRAFIWVLSAYLAIFFGIHGVISDSIWWWLLLVLVPVVGWYWIWLDRNPKARTVLSHSKNYIIAMLIMIFCLNFANMWQPTAPWQVAVKIVALFVVLSGAFTMMRRETIKRRVRDGLDHAN